MNMNIIKIAFTPAEYTVIKNAVNHRAVTLVGSDSTYDRLIYEICIELLCAFKEHDKKQMEKEVIE